jgi:hypothetical protein
MGSRIEQVVVMLFRVLNWDLHALCAVQTRLRALAERVLWRKLCDDALTTTGPGRVGNRWPALAKLLRRRRRRAGPLRPRVLVLQDIRPELHVAALLRGPPPLTMKM